MEDIKWKETRKSEEEEPLYEAHEDKSGFTIFSEEQKWFRCEKYQICDYEGKVYIKPVDNAKVEEYNPYKEYPQILVDFFLTFERLLYVKAEKRFLLPLAPEDFKHNHQIMLECAPILLEFYNKYGPLGIFFEDILSLRDKDQDLLVFIKPDTFFPRHGLAFSGKATDYEKLGIFDYERYASIFFPWLKQVPPLYAETGFVNRLYDNAYGLSPDFMKNYSEEMTLVIQHELLLKLCQTTASIKEFDLYGTQAEDTAGPGTLFLNVSFPGVSHPILNTYMMTLIRDGKDIKIGWKAKSLLGLLILLFVENLTKQRVENLTVCKFEECMRLVPGKAQYCTKSNCKPKQNQRDADQRKRDELEKERKLKELGEEFTPSS